MDTQAEARTSKSARVVTPFDADKLCGLMAEAGVDLVLANSRPNILYLTGGYYFHFHARFTRLGATQYLSFIGLPQADVAATFYVGTTNERGQMEAESLWIDRRLPAERGTVSAAQAAAAHVRALGLERAAIAVELPFLPADALLTLQRELPLARFVDATPIFDGLRARKTPQELAQLRTVHDRVAEAIQVSFYAGRPGIATAEIADRVRVEMESRGLDYLWSFTCAGPSVLRAPSRMAWERGHVLHIDAGGEERGYLADICRMGSLGEPSALARNLYDACIAVQDQVRAVVRAGLPCADLLRAGEAALQQTRFAHGMVSHEHPMIARDNRRPLEEGHVLSIETEFIHPEVGFVKIEDAVAVTESGGEGLGDRGREWQIVPV
ncbi:MAG: aminopeptidase P family protein [Chloroflexi bacterium]|nr:aminopeptidase P family protein [Chloroflexota bacterium]